MIPAIRSFDPSEADRSGLGSTVSREKCSARPERGRWEEGTVAAECGTAMRQMGRPHRLQQHRGAPAFALLSPVPTARSTTSSGGRVTS